MVFKKLLHLLRKDALLVWRSKVWTAFEILIPLLLIAAPPLLFVVFDNGSSSRGMQSSGNMNSASKIDLDNFKINYGCHNTYSNANHAKVAHFVDDHPLSYDRNLEYIVGPKMERGDYIQLARECDKVVYIVEKNLSSTIVLPKLSTGGINSQAFLGYQDLMNRVLFGFSQQRSVPPSSITDEILRSTSPISFQAGYVNQELYTLPSVSSNDYGEYLYRLFPVFFGICLTMPVISVTRNLLVEKDTVKPYLSTIGLPIWLFYLEHFIFGIIKTSILITLTSLLWIILIPGFPGFVILGILFYTFNSVSFAIFFSTIFPSAKRAVEGMVLLWIGTILVSVLYHPKGAMEWVISLLPTSALKNYIEAVVLAGDKDGTSFTALFKTKTINSQPAALYLGFMLFNTIWMLVLAIFMEKLFSFLNHVLFKQLWGILGNRKSKGSTAKGRSKAGKESTILNVQEKLDERWKAAADLYYYYWTNSVLNGLSLRAIRGQVSILLGHNGCGKSTTFGMITGINKPTEGKVLIGGIDAGLNRSEARKLIGYCPQYNPLYDKLTVMEHLRLVNALKGNDGSKFKEEAESLLAQIELTDKKNTLAKKLSGGMKRKLCVCMAMIGGSRVILLDEPTAGMDPAARIDVQKMLTLIKSNRTILLTTHYMDEAEKLGDWVFVMSHGKMAASGSIHFLKQKYGGGMLLTLVFKITSSNDQKKSYEAAFEICKTICPSAKIKDERGQMMEISISESEKSRLPALFRALEAILEHNYSSPDVEIVKNHAQKLDIVTIGVSMSSLEQVFIKIGDECDTVINRTVGIDKKVEREKRFHALMDAKKEPPKQGFSRSLTTLTALLEKRFYYLYRNPTQVIFQIILPFAFLWYFAYVFAPLHLDPTIKKMMRIESLDLSTYPASTIIVQMQDKSEHRVLDYLKTYPNFYIIEVDYYKDIEEVVRTHSMGFQRLGFVIRVSQSYDVKLYYDVYLNSKSSPAAILINLLASCMYLKSPTLRELPHISSNIYWMMDHETAADANLQEYLFIMVVITLVVAGIVIQSTVYLIEERICKFAHQQYLTGLSTITYWAVVFLWDFILFTIILLYIMIFVFAYGVFAGHQHEIILLFYSLFLYLAPVVYLTSILINSPTKGSFLIYMFCIISYFSFAIAFMSLSMNPDTTDKHKGNWGIRFISPSVGFFMGILKVAGVTYEHSGLSERAFDDLSNVWEFEGIVVDILFILIFAFLVTSLLCCVTLKPTKRACFSMTHRRSKPRSRVQYKGIESCLAVNEEEELIPKTDKNEKILVIDGLIKDFGNFRAINGLSVSVGHEECFGMLGANGAGKTTTFDIITGLTLPTGGNVTIEGKDITKTIHIGYCPQFDAMLQQISCRQTLKIMAKLQGYPNVNEVVETVLDCVGMKEHGNKLVKNCSGGQKRKISVGIALISRASCIILDEPTAGIDPRARREIWDIIHEMREQGKCSIILTSHSMEECEALCTRIGILRKGEMIALGTSQSLKSQYGNTYMMTLILNHLNDREAVCKKVNDVMPDAILKTPESSLTTSLVWEIPKKKSDKWSQKYNEVEVLARQANAKDYMLTQASLEDTFIRLITTEENKENGTKPVSK